jgi:SAM-dependent methyltransferase
LPPRKSDRAGAGRGRFTLIHQLGWRHAAASPAMEESFTRFVRSLERHGYRLRALGQTAPAFDQANAYLRHDVQPEDLDAALRLAALHQKLRVPGSFHLIWDLLANAPRRVRLARRFSEFDPAYVQLGLQCDPISGWLLYTGFADGEAGLADFVASPAFPAHLAESLAVWRTEGAAAAVLRARREGARQRLAAFDRSFRSCVGHPSSISGRGSPLSNAFFRACQARPELAAIAAWFSPIDFLISLDLASFGYAYEATRFAGDHAPGPAVMFGGVEIAELRQSLCTRTAAEAGFVAIFPAGYWDDGRYCELLPAVPPRAASRRQRSAPAAAASPAPAPNLTVLTNLADLAALAANGAWSDTRLLAEAARRKVGAGIDADFPRFIGWLRGEGYDFGGFEDGLPRFDERRAYLRHDVHLQDLLAAYVLAELHQRLAVLGSFQITWNFSRYEEAAAPYFAKILEFDRRFVQFGLHVAPTATWFLEEKLAGDYTRQREAVAGEDFVAWVRELYAAYHRDGEAAPELRRIREGTDDTLSRLAASFRETFGHWKSISGHGNFLTNGFAQACLAHPEVRELQPYFHPVAYMAKYGVARFGFDFEITSFGGDRLPFPRVLMEGADEVTRRRWYHGRVAGGAGFVALFHPASWAFRHNRGFFAPEPLPEPPPEPNNARPMAANTVARGLESALARIRGIVADEWRAAGADPGRDPAAANIEYNTSECRWRAASLRDFAQCAFGLEMPGTTVVDLGAGFGGLCLHWLVDDRAARVIAVDQMASHIAAINAIAEEFDLRGLAAIEADLQQPLPGYHEAADLVVLCDVLYTANLDPDAVARSCARLLRAGGAVVFRHVNRLHGSEVASHYRGTQFLDPGSADRAARFFTCGRVSTLAHRPLSPAGLAAFLECAGFEDFYLCGDDGLATVGTAASRGLLPRYFLGARKGRAASPPLRRLAPPPAGVFDPAPFRQAADRQSDLIRAASDRLRHMFGAGIAAEAVGAELRAYMAGRLLLDGLRSFRQGKSEAPAQNFAVAIELALDATAAALLTRHAGWQEADFQQADPAAFTAILDDCAAAARRGFRHPSDDAWAAVVDWPAAGASAVEIVTAAGATGPRLVAAAARSLRLLIADRLRLDQIELFARTADPVTGTIEEEYGEAAIDRLEGEIWDILEPGANRPRPMHRRQLICLVEQLEARIGAAIVHPQRPRQPRAGLRP